MELHVALCLLCFSTGLVVARPALSKNSLKASRPMESPRRFEGDIVLPGNVTDRNAITRDVHKWPGGRIPFVIESSLGRHIASIRRAMNEIHSRTCIRFVRRTHEVDYISLFYGDGCYSSVGLDRDPGPQAVSIGDGCIFHGTIVHELLHSVGFYHEHSRSDRDEYIDIFLDNVDDQNTDQFKKLRPHQNRLLSPFDYDSVMLYGSNAFARSKRVFTMLKKTGGRLTEVFDKPGLSEQDVFRINQLYNCPE
ncbi:astacin-like metalloprotease toxin 5 [Ornithodoros turicata]|uniref:astacin-like metalloprotease toxin 5 n=1 Tax=Ornithodoros turicata TaxID=34597 RepID=UPI003138F561